MSGPNGETSTRRYVRQTERSGSRLRAGSGRFTPEPSKPASSSAVPTGSPQTLLRAVTAVMHIRPSAMLGPRAGWSDGLWIPVRPSAAPRSRIRLGST